MWTNTKAIARGYACAVVVLLIGIAVRMILPKSERSEK